MRDIKKNFWEQEKYKQFIEYIEKEIDSGSAEIDDYLYLGLAYLVLGEEETAQLIWLSAIAEHEDYDVVNDLVTLLSSEAERLACNDKLKEAWVIYNHIREFAPDNISNLLNIINIATKLELLSEDFNEIAQAIELLKTHNIDIDTTLLLKTVEQVLSIPEQHSLDFAEACSPFLNLQQWADLLTTKAAYFGFERKLTYFSLALVELCLKYQPNNLIALNFLPRFHTDCRHYKEAVKTAKDFYLNSDSQENLFYASCILLNALGNAGDWNEIPIISAKLKSIISEIVESGSTQLSLDFIRFLIVNTGFLLYLKDDFSNRTLQNQVSHLFLKNIQSNAKRLHQPKTISLASPEKRLKIGYIASTLREHSVGWLSRWLFQNHNREEFEIYIYLVQQLPENLFFNEWFRDKVDHFRYLPNEVDKAAQIIEDDQLNILVDLDSVTLDQTCTILALKPAPVQVTWLGFDASGLPTIDYFIADPYVLPEDAQKYYQEKIWRLPHTYVAVDGFETGIPSLRRSDLDIPENAIVYWSSQGGFKRNPETIRLQMKILKGVPNSYFMIKGSGDPDTLHDIFTSIAQEEGVEAERLKFLPRSADEYTHRANLHLADIVLDTFPYTGATTTLETLWAGIPLVTRVGQQFSARNSYAFLMNVGATEGLAWTDEEYIDWGIRFGTDSQLRKDVTYKLHQAKNSSCLWNTKEFTLEMEKAYREMWNIYVKNNIK
ncbi:MAG TPA: O-linked N-acetylglucosamine transferase, SPINDLY family protein [Stenomitos sp.]